MCFSSLSAYMSVIPPPFCILSPPFSPHFAFCSFPQFLRVLLWQFLFWFSSKMKHIQENNVFIKFPHSPSPLLDAYSPTHIKVVPIIQSPYFPSQYNQHFNYFPVFKNIIYWPEIMDKNANQEFKSPRHNSLCNAAPIQFKFIWGEDSH